MANLRKDRKPRIVYADGLDWYPDSVAMKASDRDGVGKAPAHRGCWRNATNSAATRPVYRNVDAARSAARARWNRRTASAARPRPALATERESPAQAPPRAEVIAQHWATGKRIAIIRFEACRPPVEEEAARS